MPKNLLRIVAVLLIPVIVMGSIGPVGAASRPPFQSDEPFSSQALAPTVLLVHRIMNASLFPIRQTLGRLAIHKYRKARIQAVQGLTQHNLAAIRRSYRRMRRAVWLLRKMAGGAPGLDEMGAEVQRVSFAREFLATPREDLRSLAIKQITDALKQSILPDSESLLTYVRPDTTRTQKQTRAISWKRPAALAALVVAVVGFFWLLIPRAERWLNVFEDAFHGDAEISSSYDRSASSDVSDDQSATAASAPSLSDPSSLSPEAIDKELKDIDRQEKEIRERMDAAKKAAEKEEVRQKTRIQREEEQLKLETQAHQAEVQRLENEERKAEQGAAQQLQKALDAHPEADIERRHTEEANKAFEQAKQFKSGDISKTPSAPSFIQRQWSKFTNWASPVTNWIEGLSANLATMLPSWMHPSWLSDWLPKGNGIVSSNSSSSLGDKVAIRFEKPVGGFIRGYTLEQFHHGLWKPTSTSIDDMELVTSGNDAIAINHAFIHVNSRITPLKLPEDDAPIPGSLIFSNSTVHYRYEIRRDRFGLSYLRIMEGKLPVDVDYGVRNTNEKPWESTPITPDTVEKIETYDWPADSAEAMHVAESQPSFPEKVQSIFDYDQRTGEYTLSDSIAREQNWEFNHLPWKLDTTLIQIRTPNGAVEVYRPLNCGTSVLRFVAHDRQIGIPSRAVEGYMAQPPTQYITESLSHEIAEVRDPTQTGSAWEEWDAVAPDRYPNGDETRVYPTPEYLAKQSPAVKAAELRRQVAQKRLDAAKSQAERDQQKQADLAKKKNDLDEQAKGAAADRQKLEELAQRRAALEEVKTKASSGAPGSVSAVPRDGDEHLIQLHFLMERLAEFNQKLEAFAREGRPPRDLRIAAFSAMVDSISFPEDIQSRYRLEIYKLLLNHLPAADAREIYPDYLSLLKIWLESDASKNPLVFSESLGYAPNSLVEHFDVSGFLPMSTTKTSGPGVVSTLRPTQAATQGTPHQIEGAKGFVSTDQVFDAQGHPLLAPPIQANSIKRIVTTKDGRMYALADVRNNSAIRLNPYASSKNGFDTGIAVLPSGPFSGVNAMVINLLTGQPLVMPADVKNISDLQSSNDGHIYAAVQRGPINTVLINQILEIGPDGSIHPIEVKSRMNLVASNGRIFQKDVDYPYAVSEIKGEKLIPMPSFVPAAVRFQHLKAQVNSISAPPSDLRIVANPKSNGVYSIWQYGNHAAIYDEFGHSLAPDDCEVITRPSFHESDPPLYMVRRNGQWELRSTEVPEPYSTIPILLKPYEQNVQVLSSDFPIAIIRAENTLFVENIQTSEIKSFNVPEETIAINGLVYYVAQQGPHGVLHEIKGDPNSLSSWKDEVVSSKDAVDVTLPFAGNQQNDEPIFAEQMNGEWRYRRPVNENLVNIIEVKPRLSRPHHFLVEVHFHNSVLTYDWDGDRRLTQIGGLSGLAEFYETKDGLYRDSYNNNAISRWPDGQKVSEADSKSTPIHASVGPDGRLYYWGDQNGQSKLWRLPENSLIYSANPNNFIQTVEFSPDGQGHILVSEMKNIELTLYGFDGARTGKIKLRPRSSRAILYFSPDGTPYVMADTDPTWSLYNLATGKLLTDRLVPSSSGPSFSPDGKKAYFRVPYASPGGVGLLEWQVNPDNGYITHGRDVKEFSVDREGTPYLVDQNSNRRGDFTLNRITGPQASFQHAVGPYFANGTGTGIVWYSGDDKSWLPSLVVPRGLGNYKILGADMYMSIKPSADDHPQPQTDNHAPVVFVPGENGQYVLTMDPNQEERRLLEWGVGMQIQNPASITATKEWARTRQTLIEQAQPFGPFMPADTRLLLSILTDGMAGQNKFVQPLADLDTLPNSQKEAREEEARLIVSIYQDYKARHGRLPFNPAGVKTGAYSRWINYTLQLSGHWRWGQTADEKALIAFNAEILKLTNAHSWLRLNPGDVRDVWMSPEQLTERIILQAPYRWLFLFLMVELLSAAASRLADARLRRARLSIYSLFSEASASDLFQIFPGKQMTLLPAHLVPERSAWRHLRRSVTLMAFADWVRAARLAAASKRMTIRLLAEGAQSTRPIGDVGSPAQFMKAMESVVASVRHELKPNKRSKLDRIAA